MADYTFASATLSPDGVYRYDLERWWDPDQRFLLWVMLNPSTADGVLDDPTIRRCVGFSKAWGFGGMFVVNLFALRATDPKALYTHPDPIGPENDEWIEESARKCDEAVMAWGATGARFMDRALHVHELIEFRHASMCLGKTKDGHPRHPLYVASNTQAVRL